MRKLLVATFFLLLAGLRVSAADLTGRILDRKSKEPLIGATIQILGTYQGAVTNIEGIYTLSHITPGTYDIEIKYLGYKTAKVTAVKILASGPTTLDYEMETEEHVVSEVTVVGKLNREAENAALLDQRHSIIAVQGVSAKELSRKGIGDAQGAVTKVSGISKQEGIKNVFVRGLGDRYNITTLNGFPIPSEDPEYKNIALDFFSSDMIQTVGVHKAFTASGQGDVGGANIDITSKELVNGEDEFTISISGGVNTQSVGAEMLRMDGVNAFGFVRGAQPANGDADYGFQNRLAPHTVGLPMNQSYRISGGKNFHFSKDMLSLYLITSHNKQYLYYEEEVRNSATDGTLTQDQIGRKSDIETSQLALANIGYRISDKHHIAYNFMMIHDNASTIGDYTGYHSRYESSDEFLGFMRRQQTNDNMLLINQLKSQWSLGERFSLDAGLSYNIISGNEPDRRINNLVKGKQHYMPLKGNAVQQRYFSELDEDDLNLSADLTYKLNDGLDNSSYLKFGYRVRMVGDNMNNFISI